MTIAQSAAGRAALHVLRSSSAFAFFLAALVASSLSTPAEAVVVSWYYGPYEYQIGTDTPCGLSGTEPRLNGYAAHSLLPPNCDLRRQSGVLLRAPAADAQGC